MIASIRGEVIAAGNGWVVVEVGGVGLRAEIPTGRVPSAHPGAQIFLYTSLVVREDSMTLFGFATREELEMFGFLLQVSGVGPRSALGVLSELSPAEIAAAAAAENEKPFRRVSGIGPKTAKLIAVSLGGRPELAAFASPEATDTEVAGSGEPAVVATVVHALIGLGYSEMQAQDAVNDAIAAGAEPAESPLLRSALALVQAPRASRTGAPR